MPSSHPIPSIAALALSLYSSIRRIERLPLVEYVMPSERACFVVTLDNGLSEGI